jgi:predicted metal-dependent phosphoesterase TrpH
MHVHSTASELSKLGIQRSLHLPECATEPLEVYELAKARGMDFVTITDHDTIAGALQIAHLPDTFVSEELTAPFLGEPQAVHVLCYGINPADHEWLQANRHDVESCAEYLADRQITCALAHPFYAVGAPLTAQHRRRLAQLFPIWETRNGSRAKELNRPAFVYIETHGGTAIGGSDDHAGVDIGRTYTETPAAAGPQEFLANIRAMSRFYGACQTVLSPSSASDERLERLGIDPHRIVRWDRGVDLCRFSPELRDPRALPGEINVLYAGRLAREKGIDRLAEAFELAHRHDAFMFASRTDTFGQVILEAQASRLPVVAQPRMAKVSGAGA